MSKAQEIQELILKEWERQGITYQDFAQRIGCSTRSLSYWKTGENTITIDMADKALKALGLTVTLGK